MREKRRPTLDELREMPVDLWRLEALQTALDAVELGQGEIAVEANGLVDDPEITPEKVQSLREKLGQEAREAQIAAAG